jgi:uncharacterized membrane protein YgdD (TMEM256/DUF423 family)
MRAMLLWASLFGISGIALGALGAHALQAVLNDDALQSFKTGVLYQLIHALALFALGSVSSIRYAKAISILWIAGVFCFSFSIYGLVLGKTAGWPLGFLGPVTPIGGLLLMSGWAVLGVSALKIKN